MRSFIFGTCYMNKQLTLFSQSGHEHIVLTSEQLPNLEHLFSLSLSLPFVGTTDEYETFLGTLSILNPNSKMKHKHVGTSQDVPFGSLIWWIEYTQEF